MLICNFLLRLVLMTEMNAFLCLLHLEVRQVVVLEIDSQHQMQEVNALIAAAHHHRSQEEIEGMLAGCVQDWTDPDLPGPWQMAPHKQTI